MVGERRGDRERPDADILARLNLDDVLEAAVPEERSEPSRADDRQLAAEPVERGKVEVVPVTMREQHCVDSAQSARRHGSDPPQMHDPAAEHRVGEQTDAVEIDDDRCMPDVRDLSSHYVGEGDPSAALAMHLEAVASARATRRAPWP